MPDLTKSASSSLHKWNKIVLKDLSQAEKIALLKEELAKTTLDPTSKEAADLLHEA